MRRKSQPSASIAAELFRTTAKRDGDEYVINGNKIFITNAKRANYIVLVTKTDLLSGFNDSFGRLSNDERAQVWGFTLPLAASESGDNSGQAFRAELALLQKRIEDALPDALQGEMDVQRRGLIYAFPQELAGLREVLVRFLDLLFAPSKFTARPFVRGVYFTSGTQEGTPFDRVLSAIQRQFGVAASVQNATAAQGSGRSYFLRNLLQKVIFAEAHVVERNPAAHAEHVCSGHASPQ